MNRGRSSPRSASIRAADRRPSRRPTSSALPKRWSASVPELPEVETIRRTLLPHVIGARITGVEVRERRLRRPIAADFAGRLRGAQITDITRRGKYLLFHLDDGQRLLVHLGMT